MRRAIELILTAIPVTIVGAFSDHLGAKPNAIVLWMILTAVVVCGLTELVRMKRS